LTRTFFVTHQHALKTKVLFSVWQRHAECNIDTAVPSVCSSHAGIMLKQLNRHWASH